MKLIRAICIADNVTVHGFRSSFCDWVGDETSCPHDLIETALAHVIGDKAERAYRRSAALEKRQGRLLRAEQVCEGPANAQTTILRGLPPEKAASRGNLHTILFRAQRPPLPGGRLL